MDSVDSACQQVADRLRQAFEATKGLYQLGRAAQLSQDQVQRLYNLETATFQAMEHFDLLEEGDEA